MKAAWRASLGAAQGRRARYNEGESFLADRSTTMSATFYQKMGEVPRKRHIKLPREAAKSFKGEGMHYEHVVTTAGFDRAYSIMYHLRPPTLVKAYKLDGTFDCTAADEMPLRHHHLRSQDMPRSGDPIRGRIPILFNEDLTAY